MAFFDLSWSALWLREPVVWALGALTTLCVAVRFSAPWLISVIRHGYSDFIPVRYTHGLASDNYYQYTRIKKIIDGDLLVTDPLVHEYGKRHHAHATYQGSLFFCALPGFFRREVGDAYMGSTAIYPALQFVLLATLAAILTNDIGFGLLAASAVYSLDATRNLERTPNILFTGAHLALVCLLGWERLYSAPSLAADALLAFCVAISPVVSVANMIFTAYFMLGLILRDLGAAWSAHWFYAACLAGWLPFALWTLPNIRASKDMFVFGDATGEGLRRVLKITLGCYLILPTLIYAAQAAWVGANVYFYGLVLAAAILCFLTPLLHSRSSFGPNLTVVRGTVTVTLLVGTCNLWHMAVAAANFLAGKSGLESMADDASLAAGVACAATALLLAVRKARQSLAAQNDRARLMHDKDFHELTRWAKGLSAKDVVLTLDFDVNTNLPMYTPAGFYIPQAIQSTAREEEIWLRLFEACRLLGVSRQSFQGFFAKSVPHILMVFQYPGLVQHGLASLNMTYLKYLANLGKGYNMPPEEVAKRASDYGRILSAPAALSFKATVIVVSSVQALGATLREELTGHPSAKPLFVNDRYAAYALDAATLAGLEALREHAREQSVAKSGI